MIAVSDATVLSRVRIDMTTGSGFRARQPYHAAEEMALPEARAFLQETESAAIAMAAAIIKDAVVRLTADSCSVKRAAVLLGSGKPLPELARILAAHPLIHTAEGVFYREVLLRACEVCKLPVTGIREVDVLEHCAATLRVSPESLQTRLSAMGKPFGPPWTQDEKLATAAALSLL